MKLSIEEINNIENEIGLSLPEDVRNKYLESNGYIGPANIQLLFSYNAGEAEDIVKYNLFFQNESWVSDNQRKLVLVGIDGIGGNIGFDHKIGKAVLWYPVEGEHYDLIADSVTEIWQSVIKSYEDDS